jgi:hypothetical protein
LPLAGSRLALAASNTFFSSLLVVAPYPANDFTEFIVNRYLLRLAVLPLSGFGFGGGTPAGFQSRYHIVHRGTLFAWLRECGIAGKRHRRVAAPTDSALNLLDLAPLVDIRTDLLLELPSNLGFAGGFFHDSGQGLFAGLNFWLDRAV